MYLTAALLVSAAAPASAAQTRLPVGWIPTQVDFLLDHQLADGAIVGPGTLIMPYFANNGAIGLVKSGTRTGRAGALRWMEWYMSHLNTGATNVPRYSVFDYEYDRETGKETPTGDFDSVDSYASTAMNLALVAYDSGYPALRSFVVSRLGLYEKIANLMTKPAPVGVRATAGPEAGLTLAKPSYPVAYTMDNAEVYSGLVDAAALERRLGRRSQARYYQQWAASTRELMLAKLWSTTRHNWDVAVGEAADPTGLYPNGSAQLWPILYGVVAPTDPKAMSAWSHFNEVFPRWYVNVDDNYAWTSIARVAELMGDNSHARMALESIYARFAPDWTIPSSCGITPCGEWYNNEAGWFILVSLQLNPRTH